MKAQLWNLTIRTEGQHEEKNEEEASASASASSATNACNHQVMPHQQRAAFSCPRREEREKQASGRKLGGA